jgi:hypothetical protein
MSEPPDRFWQHYGDAIEASSGMRGARNLRRRIRRDPTLSEVERSELLARARYVPGCKPLPIYLDDDGAVRHTSYSDRMVDRWKLEPADGGLVFAQPR